MAPMATIVSTRGSTTTDGTSLDGAELLAVTGWELKPEGLCRGDVCLLVPDALRTGDRVDVVRLWEHLGRPVLTSGDDTVFLGEDAATKPAANAGAPAPDFALRDLAGREHRLSEHRGKKVFLASWAPW
jgi:hypothetical protein